MTPAHRWEQWEGEGFPSQKFDSIVYFYPGKVDIEDIEKRNDLAVEIHQDGIVPDKRAAHALLETAVVTHGQFERDFDAQPVFSTGVWTDNMAHETVDGTWVELDEYSD